MDEFDLIDRIRDMSATDVRVPLGIGDDAAVLLGDADTRRVVAADMLLEGRHFETATASPEQIGRKALAVNLSDLAAMASRPLAAFVTVAHRRSLGMEFARRLHAGLAELADEFQVIVAGGDTNVWDGPLVISVTAIGEVVGGRCITRSGAKAGDRVFVTGPLGGSLPSGWHLTFPPRVSEAIALHAAVDLHAMIDISDGLLADLEHISGQSGVGIELRADAVPVSDAARRIDDDRTPLEHALTDGEDFELAFCVNESDAARLRQSPPAGVMVHEIGTVLAGNGVRVLDPAGQPLTFASTGWKHRW